MSESSSATFEAETGQEFSVIRVRGELDALVAPDLETLIREECAKDIRRCIIDLTDASFIDSVGLGVLIQAQRASLERGCTIAICGAHGMIASLFKVTQIGRMIPVFKTLDEARTAPA